VNDKTVWTPRVNIVPDAAMEYGNKLYEYRGRARDQERRLVFAAKDGLTKDFTDMEIVRLLEKIGPDGKAVFRWVGAAELKTLEAGKPADWSSLYQEADPLERQRADRLLTYIRAWERRGRPSKSEAGLKKIILDTAEAENVIRISASSLRRAITAFDGDIDSLVSRHDLKGNHTDRVDDDCRAKHHEFTCNRYFVDERPDVAATHELVKTDFDEWNAALPPGAKQLTPLSLSSTRRIIESEGRFLHDFTRIGRRQASKSHRAVGRGPETCDANAVWEVDASPLPVIVLDDESGLPIGRPTVTFLLDKQSRGIPGFDLAWRAEGLRSVAAALRMGMTTKDALLAETGIQGEWPIWGVPGMIVADHARHTRATDGRGFKLICKRLGCEPSNTPVLKPWFKGQIERLMRTFFFRMMHVVPGTTFSDIFERSKERTPEKIAICKLSEIRRYIVMFIVTIYMPRLHRSLNNSPLLMFKASAAQTGIVPPPDAVKLLAILSPLYERTVQAYGIDILGLKYNSAELMEFKQLDRTARLVQANVNPDDITQAWWIDPRDGVSRPMFMAQVDRNRYRGWTMERHERVRALQRNNPELFAGDAGARRAHAMYLKQILQAAGSNGLKNRLNALRALEKLRSRGKAMFNDDYEEIAVEEGDILDGVFDGTGAAAAPVPGALAPVPFDHPDNAFPVRAGDLPDPVPEMVERKKRMPRPKKAVAVPAAATEEVPIVAAVPLTPSPAAPDVESMRAFAAMLAAKSRRVER
jgi:hypothetical protein